MRQSDRKTDSIKDEQFDWKSAWPWFVFIIYGTIITTSGTVFYISSYYLDRVFNSELPAGFSGLVLLTIASFILKKYFWKSRPGSSLWNWDWIEQTDLRSYIILIVLAIVPLYFTYDLIEFIISQKVGHIFIVYFLFLWILFSDRVVRFARKKR